MILKKLFFTLLSFSIFIGSGLIYGAEYFVSAKGKGKEASKDKPAKDLGNIISKLKAGDTVYIAGGVYTGKGDNGHYKIEVPVKIIGGYDESFTIRDPWGKYQTIFSGDNKASGFEGKARLLIELHLKYNNLTKKSPENQVMIDGIIVDNGDRNQYSNGDKKIERYANPADKKNASPQTPGIQVTSGKFVDVTVQNCVVINTAAAGGAIHVAGNKENKILIHNNLVVNNTGSGIYASTVFHINKKDITPKELATLPSFEISNNTVLFSWKFGPIDEFGGEGLKMDDNLSVTASNNVFGFGDVFGVDNIRKARFLKLKDNLITGNKKGDYREWNTVMLLNEMEDEAELVADDSTGNISDKIDIPAPKAWADIYAGRKIISRAEVEKDVKASNSSANDIRGMLGLPLKGNNVKDDSNVWLHRFPLADALKIGMKEFKGKYGCKKP